MADHYDDTEPYVPEEDAFRRCYQSEPKNTFITTGYLILKAISLHRRGLSIVRIKDEILRMAKNKYQPLWLGQYCSLGYFLDGLQECGWITRQAVRGQEIIRATKKFEFKKNKAIELVHGPEKPAPVQLPLPIPTT